MVLYKGGEWAKKQPKLLGTVENALGLREFIESKGHELVVTSDKDGPDSLFEKELEDADIVISQPFFPAYLTLERLQKAKNLKYAITAGVGSDHVDLDAIRSLAAEKPVSVYEVTGSNSDSVSEAVILAILVLLKNYSTGHALYERAEWDIAQVACNSWDLAGKTLGTIGLGRIGQHVLRRLKPWGLKEVLYYDYNELDPTHAEELGNPRKVSSVEELVKQCDIITINAPLHKGTYHLFDEKMLAQVKPGAYIVNCARGAIMDAQAVVDSLKSGHIMGYGGDVTDQQPVPKDHPWVGDGLRNTMNPKTGGGSAMTVHYSGTVLDAQKRYAAGVRDILERIWSGKQQDNANVIMEKGEYVTKNYGKR